MFSKEELLEKDIPELANIAKDLGADYKKSDDKEAIIYAILDRQAVNAGISHPLGATKRKRTRITKKETDKVYTVHGKEGENFNVFSALNMCSDEMRLHSRLLATLFNPKANHGLGNEFLRQFLVTAIKVDDNYITHCNESIAERYVGEVTETTGGRIDIILEDGKHGIIIENKIYASDQPNQLLRYHNYGVKQFGENNFKLVYLTLYGSEPSSDSLGGGHFEFIKLKVFGADCIELFFGR